MKRSTRRQPIGQATDNPSDLRQINLRLQGSLAEAICQNQQLRQRITQLECLYMETVSQLEMLLGRRGVNRDKMEEEEIPMVVHRSKSV